MLRIACLTALALWLARLSRMTMPPGLRVETSCCSTQAWKQRLLMGPSKTQRAQPVRAQGGQEGHGAPVAMGGVAFEALALLRPAPQRGHVGLDPGLVHEDQPVRVEVALERLELPRFRGWSWIWASGG